MPTNYYKRVSELVWVSKSGGCGCSGGGNTVSYNATPGTLVENTSMQKIVMTVNGRYYEFLPLKIALGVRAGDVSTVIQNPSLQEYTLDFLNHNKKEGYVV